MFLVKILKHRRDRKAATITATPMRYQQKLDQLRFDNPNDSLLQLHCDRMQESLDAMAANARVALAA